jgi:hypothetical protein
LDERNAAILDEFRDRTATAVLAEERSVWAELRPGLESLTNDDLADAGRFRDLAETISGITPWQLIASTTRITFATSARGWILSEYSMGPGR